MDADRGVEAEAAAGLPGEYVLDGVFIEEAAALELAEHAALQRALEAKHVVGSKMGGLVEGDAAVVAVGEDAVQDDDTDHGPNPRRVAGQQVARSRGQRERE